MQQQDKRSDLDSVSVPATTGIKVHSHSTTQNVFVSYFTEIYSLVCIYTV